MSSASASDSAGILGALDMHAVIRPCRGETVTGDAALVHPVAGGLLIAIIDVLGHGPLASPLARALSRAVVAYADPRPDVVLTSLHERFQGDRGAAIGLAWLAPQRNYLLYCAVGNTVLRAFGPGFPERLVSPAGILGAQMRTPRVERMALSPGAVILMYTDGVSDRLKALDFPRYPVQKAQTIATEVIERFGRAHDDSTCIVIKVLS